MRIDAKRKAFQKLSTERDKHILQAAIQEGIDSGIANDFDPKEHLEYLKTKPD